MAVVTPPRVNAAGDAAIVTVVPKTGPQSAATDHLVSRLRNQTIPTTLQASGIQTFLGGATATFDDQSNYISAHLPVFFLGIIGLSFLLLVFAFHSPLIALKAGIMNLLSIGAAYGVMTLVATGGSVGKVIGIDHQVPIAPFLPVIMFAILFRYGTKSTTTKVAQNGLPPTRRKCLQISTFRGDREFWASSRRYPTGERLPWRSALAVPAS